MKEYTTPLGHKIYVFEKVIPKDTCELLIQKMPKEGTGYLKTNDELPKYLFDLYTKYCNPSPVEFVGYVNMLSCGASCTPIVLHSDPITSPFDKWKVVMYLNDVPNGGTIFRENGVDIEIENSGGTVVLFDIRIPHLGNPKQRDMKYTIGFRPVTNSGDRIQFKPLYSRFRKH